jgi:hypothetical protein
VLINIAAVAVLGIVIGFVYFGLDRLLSRATSRVSGEQ